MPGQENSSGRQLQKNRTRRALVQAASDRVREGKSTTVTEAAEDAGISRATAYRYFPSNELLLAEVALFDSGGPLVDLTQDRPVAEVVAGLVRHVGEWAYDNEQQLRALLRLSLDPSSGIRRPGHRVEWIANALAPVRHQMDPVTYERLSRALTLLIGIDPVVAMTDIAGATREQALDTLEWTARTLVEVASRSSHPAS